MSTAIPMTGPTTAPATPSRAESTPVAVDNFGYVHKLRLESRETLRVEVQLTPRLARNIGWLLIGTVSVGLALAVLLAIGAYALGR